MSFEDLKSYEGVVYDTYLDAAKARSLVNSDEEWEKCLDEACRDQFPFALFNLFALICSQHNPVNACELFEKFKHNFYHLTMSPEIGENWALMHINESLLLCGMTNEDFQLPNYNDEILHIPNEPHISEDGYSEDELRKCIASLTKKETFLIKLTTFH